LTSRVRTTRRGAPAGYDEEVRAQREPLEPHRVAERLAAAGVRTLIGSALQSCNKRNINLRVYA